MLNSNNEGHDENRKPVSRLGVALCEAWVLPALIAVLNLIPAGRVTAQTFTTPHSFTYSDGAYPEAGLITNSSGTTLYGTTAGGGSSGKGTVFAVNTDGAGFTNLHSFTALIYYTDIYGNTHSTNSDGAEPYAGLILSGNTLYGTAQQGGSSGYGTVFSLSFWPQLTIIPSGPFLMLSWPANVAGFDYTGYRLQRANAITGSFADVPGSWSPYFVPITSPQQFFRLAQ